MAKTPNSYSSIIEQSIRLFKEKGYSNTSLDDIASACGIKKASIYYYFPSRNSLTVSVLKHVVDSFEQNTAAVDITDWSTSVEQFLSKHGDGQLLINLCVEAASSIPELSDITRGAIDNIVSQATRFVPKESDAVAKLKGIIGSVMLNRMLVEASA